MKKIILFLLLAVFSVAQANSSSNAVRALRAGEEAEKAGKFKSAEKNYRKALQAEGTSDAATLGLCRVLNQAERTEEALEILTEFINSHPFNVDAYLLHANILSKQNDFNRALVQVNKALKLRTDLAIAWEQKGEILLGLERPIEAVPAFINSRRINTKRMQSQVGLARAYFMLKRYEDAVREANNAITRFPSNFVARKTLGQALLAMKDCELASTTFQTASSIEPTDVEIHELAGDALSCEQKRQAAIEEYREALNLSPTSISITSKLVELYRETGQFEKARQTLETQIQYISDNESLIMQLAEIYVKVGRRDLVAGLLRSKLATKPDSKWINLEYAKHLYMVEQFNTASKLLSNLNERIGDASEIAIYRAAIDYRRGNLEEAKNILSNQATSEKADYAFYNSAIISFSENKESEAKVFLEKVPSSSNLYKKAQTLLAKLAKSASKDREPASANAPTQKNSMDFIEHEIKMGDSLSNISKKYYGYYKYWKFLQKLNGQGYISPSQLQMGQKILLPKKKDLVANWNKWKNFSAFEAESLIRKEVHPKENIVAKNETENTPAKDSKENTSSMSAIEREMELP